jgi:hypothetical protein
MSIEREKAAQESEQHANPYSRFAGKRPQGTTPSGASYSPKVISGDTLRDDIRTAYGN